MKKKKLQISVLLGTRPEVIKLAPVILEGKKRGHKVKVIFTGQHKQLALPLLNFFQIPIDLNLNCMKKNQSLTSLSSRVLQKMDSYESFIRADATIVQGDTTSAFIGGYWSFCKKIPLAHVEAGLRTNDLYSPFPEEANRQLISRIASFHFSPTEEATHSLIKEGLVRKKIFQTGNTAIDALHFTLDKLSNLKTLDKNHLKVKGIKFPLGPYFLVTAHRRESFGEPFVNICNGILRILEEHSHLTAIFPVHPNPNVRAPVERFLKKHPRIILTEPLAYVAFVNLMKNAEFLLTDSGGIQEEAPTLRKSILVLRDNTERPEGVKKGFSVLVGTDVRRIAQEASRALRLGCQGKGKNPYGNGKSAQEIWKVLESALY